MPKDTFINLSEEKKQKIFDAAVNEFSSKRFSEASINQIIKMAEIPRGSFYQYFKDKEDLYLYMYAQIAEEKRDIARHSENIDVDADFFEICIESTKATFDWSQHNPKYIRIGTLMEIDDSEFIRELRAASIERFARFVERDKERGLIKQETDSNLVADMVYTLIWRQSSIFGSDKELCYKKIYDGVKIIKDGIGK